MKLSGSFFIHAGYNYRNKNLLRLIRILSLNYGTLKFVACYEKSYYGFMGKNFYELQRHPGYRIVLDTVE